MHYSSSNWCYLYVIQKIWNQGRSKSWLLSSSSSGHPLICIHKTWIIWIKICSFIWSSNYRGAHFDDVVVRDGVNGGNSGAIYRRWKEGKICDNDIFKSITYAIQEHHATPSKTIMQGNPKASCNSPQKHQRTHARTHRGPTPAGQAQRRQRETTSHEWPLDEHSSVWQTRDVPWTDLTHILSRQDPWHTFAADSQDSDIWESEPAC